MEEVEAINYQYIIRCKDPPAKKTLFMNNVNSYFGCTLLKKVLSLYKEDENLFYEVFGTIGKHEELREDLRHINVLDSEDDGFMDEVIECDIIIFDIGIGQELAGARKFFKHFEQQLEASNVEKKKQVILLSTIMTWAQTESSQVLSDSSYRKRKPHPCYTNHFSLERDFINLSRKFQENVSSVVICPGIVYGGKQDVLHFIYKKSYFNSFDIEIFSPGTNYLPLIYIEDYSKIVIDVIRNPPDSNTPYILAVQPEPLKATKIVSSLVEAVGGPEMRVKICSREEIFLMDEELMTVSMNN